MIFISKYFGLFKIVFSNELQYKPVIYTGIATQLVWGLMKLIMFKALFQTDEQLFPMSFSQLTSYIWLEQIFLLFFKLWVMDNSIFENIVNGNIAYDLIYPIDLYSTWFFKNLSTRLARVFLRCIPTLIIIILLPHSYSISFPDNFIALLLSMITLLFALLIVVSFSMLIYITAFYMLSPMGARSIAISITEFLSGAIIPLPFFPDKIRAVMELTPFAFMQNFPFRIYSGHIAGEDVLNGVLLQIFWIMILIFIGKKLINKVIKNLVIQGG